jgi:hypothetical protein
VLDTFKLELRFFPHPVHSDHTVNRLN